MEENLELIGRLGQSIATDPALASLPWQACATVFSFSIDGICKGHYGYAYDGDGQSHHFTLDRAAAEAVASDYVRWLGGSVRQMLFQFDLGSGRYSLVLEHEQPGRWQATPETIGSLGALLRPNLADETADLLTIRVNGSQVATIAADQVPCEIKPDIRIDGAATVEFEDAAGTVHRHEVPASGGWLHVSVRVHAGLGCQADAVVTQVPEHRAGVPLGDDDVGVRFQPFFLSGARDVPDLEGRGLFARGLHFSGTITPGNILLSCECDACHRSFLVRSFHAGFGGQAYFYSASGRHTLIVDARVEGAPAPLAEPDTAALRALEATLPVAPDGTRFAYTNSFRCPHCDAAYIDFASHPSQRRGEYYGLYLAGSQPIRFDPAAAPERPPSALTRLRGLFR